MLVAGALGSAIRATASAVALVAVMAAATGCGGAQLAEQLGEQAIDGNVEIDEGSVSVTDEAGNEFAAGAGTEIPASWPEQVPLYPQGELVLVTSQTGGNATALWETEEAVADAAARYDRELVAAGFSRDSDADIAGTIVRSYTGSGYEARLTVARTAGTTSVNIAVVPNP